VSRRRGAGSIVITSTVRPPRAASSASAAPIVVLPTPPGPRQITRRLAARSSAADMISENEGSLFLYKLIERAGQCCNLRASEFRRV